MLMLFLEMLFNIFLYVVVALIGTFGLWLIIDWAIDFYDDNK